ncbi:MAG TPA: hypothetical protein VNR39_18755, partial [Pseudolabrys sp.]|nr:hypothetical protein [Pseudolabrys sp.]
LGGGTNIINVLASGDDISAAGVPLVAHVDTGNLVGTCGDDSITLTGLQLDHIIAGNGTIDLGAGNNDTINLKSTSAALNTLGATDGAIAGVEIVSAAAATEAVTIDLHGQSEAFTIVGGAHSDKLAGGSGNDTLTGGGGADTFVFHANFGNDTITDFTAGVDFLQFDSDVFATAQDVLAHISGGANAVIEDAAGNTVTLAGVDHASLTLADIRIYDVVNHVIIS